MVAGAIVLFDDGLNSFPTLHIFANTDVEFKSVVQALEYGLKSKGEND